MIKKESNEIIPTQIDFCVLMNYENMHLRGTLLPHSLFI